MNEALQTMLNRYNCASVRDYTNALKEIIQEIALLGLWRAKFFEHAAFYGGSALRILYGLNRFSEDLDFSLLKQNKNFKLNDYNEAVRLELVAFGLNCEIVTIDKATISNIQSAFIKVGTKLQFINVELPSKIFSKVQDNEVMKVKFEIDIDPPQFFTTEAKTLLQPIPFAVNTFTTDCLFAGKLHAVLCRKWQTRVKGRDWYDFVWYIGRDMPVNLKHLKARLVQSGDWHDSDRLDLLSLNKLLIDRCDVVDFEMAKKDVAPFLKDKDALALWSKQFFVDLVAKLKVVD